jgi:hypothetical protein
MAKKRMAKKRVITDLDVALTGYARLPKIVTPKQKKAIMKKLNAMSEHDRNFCLIMGLSAAELRISGVGAKLKV